MKTTVTLVVEPELPIEEAGYVKQILRDAIGEFISARSLPSEDAFENSDGTIGYVKRRYPDLDDAAQCHKIDEVRLRKAIARRLRKAVDNLKIELVEGHES